MPEIGDAAVLAAYSDPYSEAWLQQLIHQHPAILPLDQIEPGFGAPVSIALELPLVFGGGRSGNLDNLFVTSDGQIAVVEVKLWRNPEARRKVVAQALDYAAALFSMSYEELESAIRLARGDDLSLFEIVQQSTPDALDEADFCDSVSRNLSKGRALVIVAGDGIREDAEALSGLLQSHAGLRFVFGLVELEPYALPTGGTIVVPRVLVQTTLLERGVVRLEFLGLPEGRLVVEPPSAPTVSSKSTTARKTLGEDAFFELIDAARPGSAELLARFLEQLSPLGVAPQMGGSMSLKFPREGENDLNLGYVEKNLTVNVGPSSWFGRLAIGRVYCEKIAHLIDGQVRQSGSQDMECHVMNRDGTKPRLWQLLPDHSDAWLDAINEYLKAATADD